MPIKQIIGLWAYRVLFTSEQEALKRTINNFYFFE